MILYPSQLYKGNYRTMSLVLEVNHLVLTYNTSYIYQQCKVNGILKENKSFLLLTTQAQAFPSFPQQKESRKKEL